MGERESPAVIVTKASPQRDDHGPTRSRAHQFRGQDSGLWFPGQVLQVIHLQSARLQADARDPGVWRLLPNDKSVENHYPDLPIAHQSSCRPC